MVLVSIFLKTYAVIIHALHAHTNSTPTHTIYDTTHSCVWHGPCMCVSFRILAPAGSRSQFNMHTRASQNKCPNNSEPTNCSTPCTWYTNRTWEQRWPEIECTFQHLVRGQPWGTRLVVSSHCVCVCARVWLYVCTDVRVCICVCMWEFSCTQRHGCSFLIFRCVFFFFNWNVTRDFVFHFHISWYATCPSAYVCVYQ